MSSFLGTEFICGSYCASRLLPGAPGQELHIDYPYWDYYKSETFPLGLNSSFPQNCQATIPLDVCSELSGATAYVPGSQKKLHYPSDKDDFSILILPARVSITHDSSLSLSSITFPCIPLFVITLSPLLRELIKFFSFF